MNECKNKFTIRVAAYIIMMVCLAASAASSIIVAYSISNQYYFSGENVYTNIKETCLNEAYNDIMDEIETGNMAEYGRNGELIRLLKNEISKNILNAYCTRKWWNAPFPLKSRVSSL